MMIHGFFWFHDTSAKSGSGYHCRLRTCHHIIEPSFLGPIGWCACHPFPEMALYKLKVRVVHSFAGKSRKPGRFGWKTPLCQAKSWPVPCAVLATLPGFLAPWQRNGIGTSTCWKMTPKPFNREISFSSFCCAYWFLEGFHVPTSKPLVIQAPKKLTTCWVWVFSWCLEFFSTHQHTLLFQHLTCLSILGMLEGERCREFLPKRFWMKTDNVRQNITHSASRPKFPCLARLGYPCEWQPG